MSAAGLAKASAAAWRRIIPSSSFLTEEICAPLLQHTVAGKGMLPGGQVDSAVSTTQHPQPFTGRRFKAQLGICKPFHAYPRPPALLCPCRTYTSKTGQKFRIIPVRSLRAKGCKHDRLLSIKDFIAIAPLFRRIKGHPLIPDEANVWVLTAEGEAFFDNLGWLIFYNNECGVYVGDSLNEEMLRVSERFCCPELRNEATGRDFEGVITKKQNFQSQGVFIHDIITKYCPEVNVPPEFEEYMRGLTNSTRYLSGSEEEILLSNAALLSSESAITCTMRADLWLRRFVKFRGTPYERKKRKLILAGIAGEVCGENDELMMDIIKKDPYLNHSLKVKKERAKQNQQAQQDNSSEKKADNPAMESEKHLKEGLPEQKPMPEEKPMTEEEMKQERMKVIREKEENGDDAMGAQRDLYIHGFDSKLLKDPDVKELKHTKGYTLVELAEYQRWKLRRNLVVIQKWFTRQGYHSILGIRGLLSSNRRGTGLFREPIHPSEEEQRRWGKGR